MENKNITGLGWLDTILVVFVTLKCAHLVDWSWWFVLSPFLVPFAFCVVVELVLYMVGD